MTTHNEEKEHQNSNAGSNDCHDAKEGAEVAVKNPENSASDEGENGDFVDKALKLIWTVFLILGKLVGRVLGFILGLFLKLGIVGRVILTLVMGLFAAVVFEGMLPQFIPFGWLVRTISIIGAVGIMVWFWQWHYKVIKNIPLREFSRLMGYTFSIWFYGSIILWVILALATSMKKNVAMVSSMGICLVLAALYWLWKTNSGNQTARV